MCCCHNVYRAVLHHADLLDKVTNPAVVVGVDSVRTVGIREVEVDAVNVFNLVCRCRIKNGNVLISTQN